MQGVAVRIISTITATNSCFSQAQADLRGEEEWQQVPGRQRRQPPSRPSAVPQVPPCNRFEALKAEGEVSEDEVAGLPPSVPTVRRSAPRLKTASSRKERRVTVVGDSLLRGTEGPKCRPDPTRTEVCCLPGARVTGISRKLPGPIRPSDYYPSLIVQAGSDAVTDRSLRTIEHGFGGLGRLVHGAGVPVVFACIPTVAGKDTETTRKTHLINTWLRGWCKRTTFGFFDHGAVYSAPGLSSADGYHLSQRETDPCLGAGRTCRVGCKLDMKGEGDKTRPARDEPGGAVMGLGLRRGAQLKCAYTNAHCMGNKQEELEAFVRQASSDLVAVTETWWDRSRDWSAAMDGYKLFRKDSKEGGVAAWISMSASALRLLSSWLGMVRLNPCG